MRWYQQLYIGETARKNQNKIIEKIKKHKLQKDIYIITMPSNPKNLLDIYPANVLLQPYFQKQDLWILGIAKGYEEAIEGAGRIVVSIYQVTGSFQMQTYLKNQMFD